MEKNYFEILNSINVNEKTEKKNGLTYLSWAWALTEVLKAQPNMTYEVKKFDGLPYVYDEKTGYMVFTEVHIQGITREMWLPVMDGANKAMMKDSYTYKDRWGKEKTVDSATMFDINKTIMRCLTKNLAMFGLGLYIYQGEDLPEELAKVDTQADMPKEERIDANKKINDTQVDYLQSMIIETDTNVSKFLQAYHITKLEEMTLDTFVNEARPALEKKKAKL